MSVRAIDTLGIIFAVALLTGVLLWVVWDSSVQIEACHAKGGILMRTASDGNACLDIKVLK